MTAIILPEALQRRVEAAAGDFLRADGLPVIDFSEPKGEPALIGADSVSWRIFKNPIALFIGGVAAVILELAEPRVRAGVWDHTSFRTDPAPRLKRTGLAAMVTVYAARSQAEAMIAGVNRRHARVTGTADDGRAYAADDLELLNWVQATASYGFIEAFHRFARPLSPDERDRAWAEAGPAARLYGATGAPASSAEWQVQLDAMTPKLTASPIVFEFLDIMRAAPLLPGLARPLQSLLIRAAVDLTPPEVARIVGLEPRHGLSSWQAPIVRAAARAADRLPLKEAPPAQACLRLGLPADWLYRR
ncbi:MAG: DUF2236 domain-containing protein [Caulobacteraceae bacterium]|nr:DUF2236 domain-containing protein [Caulobacteraceae bacterium]